MEEQQRQAMRKYGWPDERQRKGLRHTAEQACGRLTRKGSEGEEESELEIQAALVTSWTQARFDPIGGLGSALKVHPLHYISS